MNSQRDGVMGRPEPVSGLQNQIAQFIAGILTVRGNASDSHVPPFGEAGMLRSLGAGKLDVLRLLAFDT